MALRYCGSIHQDACWLSCSAPCATQPSSAVQKEYGQLRLQCRYAISRSNSLLRNFVTALVAILGKAALRLEQGQEESGLTGHWATKEETQPDLNF